MNIELRHLRALAAIGDEGSITGAAAVLHVAQPALSRTLGQLEERIGTKLVDRGTRHLELTGLGQLLWERAHRILQSVDEAVAEVQAGPAPLRVGFAWSALGRHTVALLRNWKERTGTELMVRRVDDPALALRKGEIDMAFFRATPGPSAFAHALLGYEDRMIALADDNPLNRKELLSFDDLVTHRIALCSNAGTADLKLWPKNNRPEQTVIVANVDEWLTTIATGAAIGLTSDATEYSHPYPGVTYLPLSNTSPVPVYLTWARRNQHPLTDRFVAHAKQTLIHATPVTPP